MSKRHEIIEAIKSNDRLYDDLQMDGWAVEHMADFILAREAKIIEDTETIRVFTKGVFENEIARLRSALEKYGRHSGDGYNPDDCGYYFKGGKCDCGLSTVLQGGSDG